MNFFIAYQSLEINLIHSSCHCIVLNVFDQGIILFAVYFQHNLTTFVIYFEQLLYIFLTQLQHDRIFYLSAK